MTQTRRGFILLIVIAILGILTILSLRLVQVGISSSDLSTTFQHRVRARLAARTGVEQALQQLLQTNPLTLGDLWVFHGEDLNANGVLDAGEDRNGDGRLTTNTCPFNRTLRPSFPLMSGGQAAQVTLGTVQGGISGRFGTSEAPHQAWQLKIAPVEVMIDVNGGILAGQLTPTLRNRTSTTPFVFNYSTSDPLHPFNAPTVNLIDALGDYLRWRETVTGTFNWNEPFDSVWNQDPANFTVFQPDLGTPNNADNNPGLGERIVQARPAGGYRESDWKILLDTARGYFMDRLGDPSVADMLSVETGEYLTLNPRRDHDAIWIQPYTRDVASLTLNYAWVKMNINASEAGRFRMAPLPRSYININQAPRAVLASLIYGVRKVAYRKHSRINPNTTDRQLLWINSGFEKEISTHIPANENNHPTTALSNSPHSPNLKNARRSLYTLTESIRLADLILERRRTLGPFVNREHFNGFLNTFRGYDRQIPASGLTPVQLLDDTMDLRRPRMLAAILQPGTNAWSLGGPGAGGDFRHPRVLPGNNGNNRNWDELEEVIFDKLVGQYEMSTEAILAGSHDWTVTSRGVVQESGTILAEAELNVEATLWSKTTLRDQKSFNHAIGDLDTNGFDDFGNGDWISLPELPQLTPASWDGGLVLKPQTVTSMSWGQGLKARLPFDPYRSDTPAQPATGIVDWDVHDPNRPYNSPALFGWSLPDNPQEPPLSQLSDENKNERTAFSPGGGLAQTFEQGGFDANTRFIRQVSFDVKDHLNPEQGAISFFIKPHAEWHDERPQFWIANHRQNNHNPLDGTALMTWDFALRDATTGKQFIGQLLVMRGNVGARNLFAIGNLGPNRNDIVPGHFPKTDPGPANSILFPDMQGSVLDKALLTSDRQGFQKRFRLWVEFKLWPVAPSIVDPADIAYTVETGLAAPDADPEHAYSVAKSFTLDYPGAIADDSGRARDPFDAHRWHHVVIAWKDMVNLLDFNTPGHHGGCLGLWHDGVLKGTMGEHPYDGQFWSTHLNMWVTDDDTQRAFVSVPAFRETDLPPPPSKADAWAHIQSWAAANAPTICSNFWNHPSIPAHSPPTLLRVPADQPTSGWLYTITDPWGGTTYNSADDLPSTTWNLGDIRLVPQIPMQAGTNTFTLTPYTYTLQASHTGQIPQVPGQGILDSKSADRVSGTTLMPLAYLTKISTHWGHPSENNKVEWATFGDQMDMQREAFDQARAYEFLGARLNKLHLGHIPEYTRRNGGSYGAANRELGRYFDLCLFAGPGPALDQGTGFQPTISDYSASVYGDRSATPASLDLKPLRDLGSAPVKVFGLGWEARLPRYHDLDYQDPSDVRDLQQEAWDELQTQLADNTATLNTLWSAYMAGTSSTATYDATYATPKDVTLSGFTRVPGQSPRFVICYGVDQILTDDLDLDGGVINMLSKAPGSGGWNDGELTLRPAVAYTDGISTIWDVTGLHTISVPAWTAAAGDGRVADTAHDLALRLKPPAAFGPGIDIRQTNSSDPDIFWSVSAPAVVPKDFTFTLECQTGPSRRRLNVTPIVHEINVYWKRPGDNPIRSARWND